MVSQRGHPRGGGTGPGAYLLGADMEMQIGAWLMHRLDEGTWYSCSGLSGGPRSLSRSSPPLLKGFWGLWCGDSGRWTVRRFHQTGVFHLILFIAQGVLMLFRSAWFSR